MLNQWAKAKPITSAVGEREAKDPFAMFAIAMIAQAARDNAVCFFEPGGGYDLWLDYLRVCGLMPDGIRPIPARIQKKGKVD